VAWLVVEHCPRCLARARITVKLASPGAKARGRPRETGAPTMTLETAPKRPARVTVYVQHHPRGDWEVLAAGSKGRILCETLEDARRIAYLSVAHSHDCEVIVRDAYNRVLQRELIDDHRPAHRPPRRPHAHDPAGA
jgi:hypothetical protein